MPGNSGLIRPWSESREPMSAIWMVLLYGYPLFGSCFEILFHFSGLADWMPSSIMQRESSQQNGLLPSWHSSSDRRNAKVVRTTPRKKRHRTIRLVTISVHSFHFTVWVEKTFGTFARWRRGWWISVSLQESSYRRFEFYGQRNRATCLSTIFWYSTKDRRWTWSAEYSTVGWSCAWVSDYSEDLKSRRG